MPSTGIIIATEKTLNTTLRKLKKILSATLGFIRDIAKNLPVIIHYDGLKCKRGNSHFHYYGQ
jgi:hypothetical protein